MIFLCIFLYVIVIPLFKSWVELICKEIDKDLEPVVIHICCAVWPLYAMLYILDVIVDLSGTLRGR